jgi:hypothetical protein
MNDVDSVAHLVETYSKQPQYIRIYILIESRLEGGG